MAAFGQCLDGKNQFWGFFRIVFRSFVFLWKRAGEESFKDIGASLENVNKRRF